MTLRARMAAGVPVAAAFLVLTMVPAVSVEDSMMLDLRFRDSLARGVPFSSEGEQPASRQPNEVQTPQRHIVQPKRALHKSSAEKP
jgi:hypothetical protein